MNANVAREGWARYLTQFTKRNQSRPTWLQVFGEAGAQSIEQGLPLAGISLEERGPDAPRVQIMLGGHDANDQRHLTHMMRNVERVRPQIGTDAVTAIEFVDKHGGASLLIFRHCAQMAAHA